MTIKVKTQGTGTMYPSTRSGGASRPEQVALETNTTFDQNDAWRTADLPADSGPPYAVKGAAHAHDRIEERTSLSKDNIHPLQSAVDFLGLAPGAYHLPLRGKDGTILGYAQFKGVPNRKGPVLATVLGPHMTPGGTDLESWVKRASAPATNIPSRSKGLFDTDIREPLPPESLAWHGTHAVATNKETAPYALRRAFDGLEHSTDGTMERTV